MFDIYGDDICLDGIKIGRLEGGWPTLQAEARALLTGNGAEIEGYVSEADHATEIDRAYDEGYQNGFEAGQDDERELNER